MTSPLEGELSLVDLERDVAAQWERTDLRDAFVERGRSGDDPWVTYEGPPTVNGTPALHHMWTSVYKDVYPRFQVMRGRRVERKGGWDCQGLPVEINVEKELGLTSKPDIERYGVKEFTERCQDLVERSIGEFERLFDRIAFWVDIDEPYRTMDDDYIESVWWHLRRMWDEGLVFEGHRVMPYCTRCGTVLSSHELGQPGVYRDVVDDAAFAALKVDGRPWELVVWTTTPWTLVANVAVAVGADRTYGVYERDGRHYVVATDRASELFGEVEPSETVMGSELAGLTYERPYLQDGDDVGPGRVVAWEGVTEGVGTGMVHLAPAFGEEDYQVGEQEGLSLVNPIDERGHYTVGPFEGLHVHAAIPEVLHDLSERGMLVAREDYEHSYPHCWRCHTPLVYWAKPSWFIGTSRVRQRLVDENEKVTWYPNSIKYGRFGQWLADNVDWSMARDRYWGTPLPVWQCGDGHVTFVGSRAQLTELTGSDQSGLRLHRPDVDEVVFDCPDCGAEARRIPPVCDVWLDSGCMPAAQFHHPANGDDPDPERFPADFICEAIDQTRGWFYSLLAVGTMVFDSTPYRNVVCLGHLVDDEGRKMSKSLGNVIDPFEVIDRFGADGTRWYLFSSGAPWGARRVSMEAIDARVRRDLSRLWNVASFYLTYARIEGFVPDGPPSDPSHVLDRWLLSRLDGLVASVTDHLEHYAAHTAAEEIAGFIDELSNWYVRRGRRRYYSSDDLDAFRTLHHALTTVSTLLAPFTPYLADGLYRAIQGEDTDAGSVHLVDWPATTGHRDRTLEEQMGTGRTIASLIRAARTDAGVPVRQPLRHALLFGAVALPDHVRREVEVEGNVHELRVGTADEVPLTREAQPVWRALGPRYKDVVQQIGAALGELPQETIAELAGGHAIELEVADRTVEIGPDDVTIVERVREGWVTAQDGPVQLALDTQLDDELVAEFKRRTFVRNVQVARREAGLEVTDRIELWLPSELWDARDEIASEVLAREVAPLADADGAADLVRGDDFAFRRV